LENPPGVSTFFSGVAQGLRDNEKKETGAFLVILVE
jgi:hypothetical protein